MAENRLTRSTRNNKLAPVNINSSDLLTRLSNINTDDISINYLKYIINNHISSDDFTVCPIIDISLNTTHTSLKILTKMLKTSDNLTIKEIYNILTNNGQGLIINNKSGGHIRKNRFSGTKDIDINIVEWNRLANIIYTGSPDDMMSRLRGMYVFPEKRVSKFQLTHAKLLEENIGIPAVNNDEPFVTTEILNGVIKNILEENSKRPTRNLNESIYRMSDSVYEGSNEVMNAIQIFLENTIESSIVSNSELVNGKFLAEFKVGESVDADAERTASKFRIFWQFSDTRVLVDVMWNKLICHLLDTDLINRNIILHDFSCGIINTPQTYGIQYTKDGPADIVQFDFTKCYDSVLWEVIELLLTKCFKRRFNYKFNDETRANKYSHYFVNIYMTLLRNSIMDYNGNPILITTGLPTGLISSRAVIAWCLEEIIYMWLEKIDYKIEEDFIIKVYVDDIFIRFLTTRAKSNVSEIVQSFWDFMQSFGFTFNSKKCLADPALNIKLITKTDGANNVQFELPELTVRDKYLGIPYTRDPKIYLEVLFTEIPNKKMEFTKFNSWLAIIGVLEHPRLIHYYKWKLRPFFIREPSYKELKDWLIENTLGNYKALTIEDSVPFIRKTALSRERVTELSASDIKSLIENEAILKASNKSGFIEQIAQGYEQTIHLNGNFEKLEQTQLNIIILETGASITKNPDNTITITGPEQACNIAKKYILDKHNNISVSPNSNVNPSLKPPSDNKVIKVKVRFSDNDVGWYNLRDLLIESGTISTFNDGREFKIVVSSSFWPMKGGKLTRRKRKNKTITAKKRK